LPSANYTLKEAVSPWADQVDAINQIMKDTGERNESALLRKLVDEALEARRRKSPLAPFTEDQMPMV
jgi:hypothetical protein